MLFFSGKGSSGEVCDSPQSRGNSPGDHRSPRRSAGVTPGRTAWWAGYFGDAAKLSWMIVEDTYAGCVRQKIAISKSSRANSQEVSQSPHRVKESGGAGIELGSSSDDDEAGKWLIRPDVVISGPEICFSTLSTTLLRSTQVTMNWGYSLNEAFS